MRILFSHTNYPSQFRRIVPHFISNGHDLCFISRNKEWHALPSPGLNLVSYQYSRPPVSPLLHPYLSRLESAILEGQAAFRAAAAFPVPPLRLTMLAQPSCHFCPHRLSLAAAWRADTLAWSGPASR